MDKSFYRNCVLIGAAVLMGAIASATPTVSGLKATKLSPWGLAIDYTISNATAEDESLKPGFEVTCNGTTYSPKTLLGDASFSNGVHRVYWNAAKDGITAKLADATVRIVYYPLYCVVTLSAGPDATSYPVAYLDAEPTGGFNTDEYKTSKLVLKRVNQGTFIMGETQTTYSQGSYVPNESCRVTLTKPFYMGLFEVTRQQWYQVMGTAVTALAQNETKALNYVSYDMIRGDNEGAKWPSSNNVDGDSFFGKLRARTDLDFDLPTEAQWEYACRAGTTTIYSYGIDADGKYMWYTENSTNKIQNVGTRLPNPWGFYDMHGNVSEWCLNKVSTMYGIDPKGLDSSSTGSNNKSFYREARGGYAVGAAKVCASYSKDSANESTHVSAFASKWVGFRIAWTLP